MSACNAQETSQPEFPRTLTNDEAQIFSRVLYNNFNKGTSGFRVAEKESSSFLATGMVDWKNNNIWIDADLDLDQQIDLSTICLEDYVLESFMYLNTIVSDNSSDDKVWVKRDLMTQNYKTDVLCVLVKELVASTPENPLLIRQDGTEILAQESTDQGLIYIFQRSEKAKYFVNENSDLIRIEILPRGFTKILKIDFYDLEQKDIDLPDTGSAIDIDDIFNDYLVERPNF